MSKQFERTLEAATDQTVVDTDWSGIMECIDMVRGKDVGAKDAASAISRRLKNSNPNVVHHTLVLLEACMKNCGTAFHAEIMSTRFLDQLKDIVVTSSPGKVQEKILELIQVWHSAFAKKQEYAAISDVHRILKHHGYKFPAAKESDVMFAAQCAPDWVDGDQCFRCRSEFGLFMRKHHCRACGQIFCDRCSSHQLLLPQFGIEKKVRVCDTCYEKNNKKVVTVSQPSKKDDEQEKRRLKELEEKEQEELDLAIALSQSEAEHKKQQRHHQWTPVVADTPSYLPSSNDGNESIYKGAMSVTDERPLPAADNLSVDSNLARYLDRAYWEKTSNDNASAVAPPPSDTSYSSNRNGINNFMFSANNHVDVTKQHVDPVASSDSVSKKFQNMAVNDEEDADFGRTKAFCDHVQERIDIMDNRMRSNLMRGRSIVNDSSIHQLFVQLTDMHGDVLERLNNLENQREYYERLQDHLAHIQESRQAVNALREEHERQRQERLLAEQRERQSQMQQKLAIMRLKKQEMLINQRHVALQRFQEQELNMQQRKAMNPQQMGYPEGAYSVQQPNGGMPMNYYVQPMSSQSVVNPIPMHPAAPMQYPQQSMPPMSMASQQYQPHFPTNGMMGGIPQQYMPQQQPQYSMMPNTMHPQFPQQDPQQQHMYINPHQQNQMFYPPGNPQN